MGTISTTTGLTLYDRVIDGSDIYDFAADAFDDIATADAGDCSVERSEIGATGFYTQPSFGTIPNGTYLHEVCVQTGDEPDFNDPVIFRDPEAEIVDGTPSSSVAAGEDLITLAEAATHLGITGSGYDTLLQTLITAASYAILKYCDRDSFKSTAHNTVVNGNGEWWYALHNTPVTTLTNVIMDLNETTPSTYSGSVFDCETFTGEIRFKPTATNTSPFICGFQNLRVIYTAGYSTIPEDLKLACKELVKYLFHNTNVNSSLKSEKIGDYAYENFQAAIGKAQSGLENWPGLENVRGLLCNGGYYKIHMTV